MKKLLLSLLIALLTLSASAQTLTRSMKITRADSLRGGITPERIWWNVLHYDIHVAFEPRDSTLRGHNVIQYKVLSSKQEMQIDLMEPLLIDSILQNKTKVKFTREGAAFHVALTQLQAPNAINSVDVYYHGKPRAARRPPWDGGVIWAKDAQGRSWISAACQGMGSSVWYPCKDHQYDEPDSATLSMTVAADQAGVANGRLKGKKTEPDGSVTWTWSVTSPINDYNIIPYIGHYTNFTEVYKGEKGDLDVSYWVLDYNADKAHAHLQPEVNRMLKSLEHWFGPYPFYEDGYKIVDAPHLGMEHQSAIAYGNKYGNGYLGRDLSYSGWGNKWDFIVVHESAHEWFGNNITTKDLADMWVHESFANYSETLFTESEYGKEAGSDYIVGTRKDIGNKTPIIGIYNVNKGGSGDMYPKGGNMLHTIRQLISNDEKFRQILRGMGKEFYHQTVTTQQIENYISTQAGINFSKVFDQYLRTIQIPQFTYSTKKKGYLTYSWTNVIPGFNMPVVVYIDSKPVKLEPTEKPKELKIGKAVLAEKIVDRNFYVTEKKE